MKIQRHWKDDAIPLSRPAQPRKTHSTILPGHGVTLDTRGSDILGWPSFPVRVRLPETSLSHPLHVASTAFKISGLSLDIASVSVC